LATKTAGNPDKIGWHDPDKPFNYSSSTMSALNPTDLLRHSLAQAQKRHRLFPTAQGQTPAVVVVGVSGGADSVCLLHLLVAVAHSWNMALHVAHLDHNVRSNSAEDAAFVRDLAEELGLPFHTRRLFQAEIDGADNNLEAALRRRRYGFFADVAASLAAEQSALPCVAVAHTADDQAETILMHVLRGSGLAGLVGMRPVSFLPVDQSNAQPIRLVRPLLNVQHTHILQYLNVRDLTWREDPSNQDLALTRNRLRHQILPQLAELYPNPTGSLARLSEILAAENARAEKLNEQAFRALLLLDAEQGKTENPTRAVMERDAFRALDVATQRGVLRNAALYVGLPLEELNYERIDSLRLAIISDKLSSPSPTPLTGQIAWSAEPARFSLHQRSVLAFAPKTPFLDNHWRACFGARSVPTSGAVRVGEWRLVCQEITQADQGIDMDVTFRDDAGDATGQKVHLQLKSGDSYLTIRKKDGAEIFKSFNQRQVRFWMDQAFPVILVIRNSNGEIRWMEIRDHLKEVTGNGTKQVRQLEFVGQRFDVMSVRRWRDDALGNK